MSDHHNQQRGIGNRPGDGRGYKARELAMEKPYAPYEELRSFPYKAPT